MGRRNGIRELSRLIGVTNMARKTGAAWGQMEDRETKKTDVHRQALDEGE